jgi:UDP:flavonoid glycosyltransferase YjiC (YdhE family)
VGDAPAGSRSAAASDHVRDRPLRVYLGAFGDPGHAFPMVALGAALAARGHAVALQTWRRWEEAVEAAGIEFAAAPEYQVFPARERPLTPHQAAVHAAGATVPSVESFAPDVAVSDVVTHAPALAAELCGVPVATLVPHVHPWSAPGFPPYSLGARLPRTPAGAWLWRRFDGAVAKGLERGRREYNDCRARLGLPPLPGVFNGLPRSLTMIATLPQLEYPRRWEPWLRVVGPLLWEPPGEHVPPPPGDGPVVLVATSTAQDPEHHLLRAALEGLARAPVRVIATYNGRWPDPPVAVPSNAVLVPWMSYARSMPAADVVVTHGGHGTLVRALSCGCALVVCPAGGDMAENAARADWAGVGVRVPRRLLGPRTLRLAVERALRDERMRARARAVSAWMAEHDGARAAAIEVERWASLRGNGRPVGRADPDGAALDEL